MVGRNCAGYSYTPILTPKLLSPGGRELYCIAPMVGYFDVWLFSLLDTVVQQETACKALYYCMIDAGSFKCFWTVHEIEGNVIPSPLNGSPDKVELLPTVCSIS